MFGLKVNRLNYIEFLSQNNRSEIQINNHNHIF